MNIEPILKQCVRRPITGDATFYDTPYGVIAITAHERFVLEKSDEELLREKLNKLIWQDAQPE